MSSRTGRSTKKSDAAAASVLDWIARGVVRKAGGRRRVPKKKKNGTVSAAKKAQLINRRNTKWSEDESSSDSDEHYRGNEMDSDAIRQAGYMKLEPGRILNDRYVVNKRLGFGSFSMVYLARDLNAEGSGSKKNEYVALKVHKTGEKNESAATDEIAFLKKLNEVAEERGSDLDGLVKLLNVFKIYERGLHYVMVFPVYGRNPHDVLKEFDRGLPTALCKLITRDVLRGVANLHKAGIMHMDIKPENCVFTNTVDFIEADLKQEQEHFALRKVQHSLSVTKKKLEHAKPGQLKKTQKRRLKAKIKTLQAKLDDSPLLAAELITKKEMDRNDRIRFVQKFIENLEILEVDDMEGEDLVDEFALETAGLPQTVLVDLGCAMWSEKVNTSHVGTRNYRSPEQIAKLRYTDKADIWAVACMCIELLSGRLFFDPYDTDEHGNKIDEDGEHLRLICETMASRLPKALCKGFAREFVTQKGEFKRDKVSKTGGLRLVLLEHVDTRVPDFDSMLEFLEPMLEIDPERRATAEECLQHPWLKVTANDLWEAQLYFNEVLEKKLSKLNTDAAVSEPSKDGDVASEEGPSAEQAEPTEEISKKLEEVAASILPGGGETSLITNKTG